MDRKIKLPPEPLRTISPERCAEIEAEHLERFFREIEESRQRDARKRELWGDGTGAEQMARLCAMFHSLEGVPGVSPWDAPTLLRWLCTSPAVTSGSSHAAKFVLRVWNNNLDWEEAAREEGWLKRGERLKPFDLFAALNCWDAGNARAFRAWIEAPFWP